MSRAQDAQPTTLVARSIPGELVRAQIDGNRRPRQGVALRILEPSPLRVVAPCPYYEGGCGGCQLQHLPYESQLRLKSQLARRELDANDIDHDIHAVYGMENPWRYRNTGAIAIGWEAGFRPLGRRGIIEVRDCPISHPIIGGLADQLNDALRSARLPNYHGKVWMDCTVTGSEASPRLQVLIQGISGLSLDTHPELPGVASVLASLVGVGSVAFRHRDGRAVPLVGDLMDTLEVAGRTMYVPNGAFFQTNLRMLPRLLARLEEETAAERLRHAADVYGGVGTLGLRLAGHVGELSLIELDGQAVEAARRTGLAWGLNNVHFISAHAEKALSGIHNLDLAIVDPPRAGLGPKVVGALVDSTTRLLLYVSCAPPSLARDLTGLVTGGFALRSLELFDFYPQTYHVEVLAVLKR